MRRRLRRPWAAGYEPTWGENELECECYGLVCYDQLHAEDASFDYRAADVVYVARSEDQFARHIQPVASCKGIQDQRC